MTRSNRHRIQRQIVELAIGDSADGQAVHRELARPFWDRAVPELERAFDAVAGPHELLRLDRLELDLGQIGGADWPIEFRSRLIAELTRSLAQFTAVSEAPEKHAPRDPGQTEPWQEFLFFLSHGYLPWWAARPSDGWIETLLQQLDAAGWSALREAALADPRARVRLVQSVSDAFLDTAIGRWAGVPHAAGMLEHWTPVSRHPDARQRWRREFWIAVLEWVCAGGFRSSRGGPQLVRHLRSLRSAAESAIDRRESGALPARDVHEDEGPVRAAWNEALLSPWREWLSEAGTVAFDRAGPPTRTDTSTRPDRLRAPAPSRRAAPKENQRPAENDAIYLAGAGAILLHPFLEPLFRDRGLLAGRTFRDTEARDRAVHLLGVLTFGRVAVYEYELVLAKVLCGLALEEPLEPVPLDDDDVAACDTVLRAVLTHWQALRSSSLEWLRQQFLLREGKLETVDSGYRLTVERRAQDVLLARLPWGFGVVGVPWLADQVFVRWLE